MAAIITSFIPSHAAQEFAIDRLEANHCEFYIFPAIFLCATGFALISRTSRRHTPYADTGDAVMNCVIYSCFEALHTIASIILIRHRPLLQLLLKSSDPLVNRPLSSPLNTCTIPWVIDLSRRTNSANCGYGHFSHPCRDRWP
jgi:hypothetical protein